MTTLRKGDVVGGLTGEVWSNPRLVKADRDIPETEIKVGDIFYVLHYVGEGEWKIWFKGRFDYIGEIVKFTPPKATWWVKIKAPNGRVGWSISKGNFLHQDACE